MFNLCVPKFFIHLISHLLTDSWSLSLSRANMKESAYSWLKALLLISCFPELPLLILSLSKIKMNRGRLTRWMQKGKRKRDREKKAGVSCKCWFQLKPKLSPKHRRKHARTFSTFMLQAKAQKQSDYSGRVNSSANKHKWPRGQTYVWSTRRKIPFTYCENTAWAVYSMSSVCTFTQT